MTSARDRLPGEEKLDPMHCNRVKEEALKTS